MWLSLTGGIATYITVVTAVMNGEQVGFFDAIKPAFVPAVFLSTAVSLLGMTAGSLLGKADDFLKLKRFYVIVNTPVGADQRLVEAGIRLPAMIDAGLVPEGPEELNIEVLDELYAEDSKDKILGADSTIELRKEPGFEWYFPGFVRITLACFALVGATWLITRLLFVW